MNDEAGCTETQTNKPTNEQSDNLRSDFPSFFPSRHETKKGRLIAINKVRKVRTNERTEFNFTSQNAIITNLRPREQGKEGK